MTSRKLGWILSALILLTMGCQPARQQQRERIGRNNSALSGNRTANTSVGSNGIAASKMWGAITSDQGDQAFDNTLSYFMLPTMQSLSANYQLGYVSSQAGQATGVRFYGNAVTTGASNASVRTFDTKSMSIHFEVYQADAAGNIGDVLSFSIGQDYEGFKQASGQLNGSQADLVFQDSSGIVRLTGNVDNQNFSGTIYFSTGDGSGGMSPLGYFSVPTCGFFQCQ